jgi:hypothetical protein
MGTDRSTSSQPQERANAFEEATQADRREHKDVWLSESGNIPTPTMAFWLAKGVLRLGGSLVLPICQSSGSIT